MKSSSRTIKALLGGGILLLGVALTGQALAQGGTWATKTPMPTARVALAGATVDGIIYAIGGYNEDGGFRLFGSNEAYDPVTNSWTTKAPIRRPRYVLAAAAVKGVVYAVGGNNGGAIVDTMEAYDPVTNTWITRAAMPTLRSGLAAEGVNGIVYAIGGGGYSGPLNTVEAYDPTTNTWSSRANMPTARIALAAVSVNGIVYAIGGTLDNTTHFSTVEAYDPATNTWSSKASMPTARSGLAAVEVNGIIYAIGGYNGSRLATVEAYDPATNTWSSNVAMPTARSNMVAAAVNGSVYTVGGLATKASSAANEAFTPTPADTIPPVLTLPGDITAGATSPVGAVVNYTVTATDDSGAVPTIDCTVASGSTFPIGITTVICDATDTAGNLSSGSFTVTVLGSSAQTTNLIALIGGLGLPGGTANSLSSKLDNAVAVLASGNVSAACNMLNAFINQSSAQSGKQLTVAQASQLIDAANHIRAAQGCQ